MHLAVTAATCDSDPTALGILPKLQSEAVERFELELNDMLAAAMAVATRCERSLAKLGDGRRVSSEAVSRAMTDLTAAADRERARAAGLAKDLEAARRELEQARAESRTERKRAQSAVEAEARAREALTVTQARNQEIADAQLLRLVELTRELRLARAAAAVAGPTANLRQRAGAAGTPRQPVPRPNHLAPEFAAIEAALACTPPVSAPWQEIA
ncbi:MAG: hypothetical protein ACM3SQ_07230 [Betaproteobacteria bacterium]